jgi:hypothetical protein
MYSTAFLTIGGFLFTLLTYLIFPDLRTATQILVFWLTGASVGYIATNFITPRNDGSQICTLESFCVQYFSLVVIFTTVVVAQNMHKIFRVYQTKPLDCRVEVEMYHALFVWGVPIIFAFIPLFADVYGKNNSDLYCWIKTDSESEHKNNLGVICQVICFLVPLFLSVTHNCWVYYSISSKAQELKVL